MYRRIKEGFLAFTRDIAARLPRRPSMRSRAWAVFQDHVALHIENYTVRQYGDYPEDLAINYTAEYCVAQIKKYAERYGKGQRGNENEEMDLLKIAHFACMAFLQKHYNVPELMEELSDARLESVTSDASRDCRTTEG